MDLELSDEQSWLSESVETLLAREWPAPSGARAAAARRLWRRSSVRRPQRGRR